MNEFDIRHHKIMNFNMDNRFNLSFNNRVSHEAYYQLIHEFGESSTVDIVDDVLELYWSREVLRDRLRCWEDITLSDSITEYPNGFKSNTYYRFYLPLIEKDEHEQIKLTKDLNEIADNMSYNLKKNILTLHVDSSQNAYALTVLAIQLIEGYNYPGKPGNEDIPIDINVIKRGNLVKKYLDNVSKGSNTYRIDYKSYYNRVVCMYSNHARIYRHAHVL